MRHAAADVTVIGGGPAGCEAAWQLAEAGLRVVLVDGKASALSPAHQTPLLCELVCSNSLRSDDEATPAGLLKRELRAAGSLMIDAAEHNRVPAGAALAVERFGFAREMTTRLALHPNVRIERRLVNEIPQGRVIVATGPLTMGGLGDQLLAICGSDKFYFYDAIAPIVAAESIDPAHSFRASRWGKDSPAMPAEEPPTDGEPGGVTSTALRGPQNSVSCSDGDITEGGGHGGPTGSSGAICVRVPAGTDRAGVIPHDPASCSGGDLTGGGDYINCPVDRDTYYQLVREIRDARKVVPRQFEEPRYFEGCMPIEVMVDRGDDVLRHGPMRPVGLTDPRTGRWPFAALQLRPENRYLTAYNLVGFQTRLAYPEQQRIFSMIPALREAEFLRFGSVHRNSYLDSRMLGQSFELTARPSVHIAGLLTGVEGYIESCAMGLLVAWFVAAELRGHALAAPPPTTALGGLYHHVSRRRAKDEKYAPTNINFGLLPPLGIKAKKRDRNRLLADRAATDFDAWLLAQRPARATA